MLPFAETFFAGVAAGARFVDDGDVARRGTFLPGSGQALVRQLTELRVLIVEDEVLIAFELEEMFRRLGVEVVGTARSCSEALHMVQRTSPDFLTMDVNLMGERDGVSAALEIYERHGVRSIFITAFADKPTIERARSARPLGWLSKPVTRREFARVLPVLVAEL